MASQPLPELGRRLAGRVTTNLDQPQLMEALTEVDSLLPALLQADRAAELLRWGRAGAWPTAGHRCPSPHHHPMLSEGVPVPAGAWLSALPRCPACCCPRAWARRGPSGQHRRPGSYLLAGGGCLWHCRHNFEGPGPAGQG